MSVTAQAIFEEFKGLNAEQAGVIAELRAMVKAQAREIEEQAIELTRIRSEGITVPSAPS